MAASIFPFCGDEPNGTLVESFPIATCEGAYRQLEYSGPVVRRLVDGTDAAVFAVFATEDSRFDESFYSHANPSHVIVIQRSQGERKFGVAVLVDEQGLVGSLSGCADTPESMISFWELTEAIVPPPPTVTPTPTPQPITNRTEIESVDEVLRIIEENDEEALEAMGRTIEVPCKKEHPIAPYPPCPRMEEEETIVAAIPASFCSQHYQRGIGDLSTFFRLGDDRQILAVYPTTGSLLQENFLGVVEHEYVVFFTAGLAHSPRTTMLLLDEEAIVAYGNTCQFSLEDFILGQHLTDPIIPPPDER